MSDNPFDSREIAPSATETTQEPLGKTADKNPLWFPAQCLIVLSINNMLLVFMLTIYKYFTNLPIETSPFVEFLGAANGVCVLQAIVLWGSINMQRQKGFVVARIGAALAAFPFTSPLIFVGMPFGIWAMILLAKPKVRELFE